MKWLIYILITAAVIVIEQGLFRVVHLGAFAPDLFLLLTLATLWSSNNFDYLIFAVFGGLWLELVTGLPVGSISLGLVIVGTGSYWILHRWLFSEKPWQYFLLAVVVGTFVQNVWLCVYVAVLSIFSWTYMQLNFSIIMHRTLLSLLLNIILIYPVYIVIELIVKYLQTASRNKLKL